jgi:CBS domain-containing protein
MTARSVKDLMTSDLTTVAPETSVSEAAERMAREDIGPLPVVEDDRLVGIVTDRDLVVRVLAEGRDPRSTTVGIVAQADVAREVSSPWVGDVVEDISRDNDS